MMAQEQVKEWSLECQLPDEILQNAPSEANCSNHYVTIAGLVDNTTAADFNAIVASVMANKTDPTANCFDYVLCLCVVRPHSLS